MDGIQLKPLTVSFSEPGFVSKLSQENLFGPWFTLGSKERQQLGSPMGPQNPQSLNRYSYVLNNPFTGTDPSGHTAYLSNAEARELVGALNQLVIDVGVADTVAGAIAALNQTNQNLAKVSLACAGFFSAIAGALIEAVSAVAVGGLGIGAAAVGSAIASVATLANQIDSMNGNEGVALAVTNGTLLIADRQNGKLKSWDPGLSPGGQLILSQLSSSWKLGSGVIGDPNWRQGYHFTEDEK